jgi:putative FmdB family regulatory protein
MPIYTYRREDGTSFELRQSFSDEPLQVDPQTGQKVQRVIQSAGVIFKGSGFYVTDTRGANNPAKPKTSEPTSSTSSSSESSSTTSTSTPTTSTKDSKASSPSSAAAAD